MKSTVVIVLSLLMFSAGAKKVPYWTSRFYGSAPVPGIDTPEERRAFLEASYKYKGTPYGTGPGELVCNFLVHRSAEDIGIPLHLVTAHDMAMTYKWKKGRGQMGDVWFFKHSANRVAHVGINVGDDTMNNATSSKGVRISKVPKGPSKWLK